MLLSPPARPSLPARLRRTSFAAAFAVGAALTLGLAPAADAALTLSKEAPANVLFGNQSAVSLRVTNATPGPYGYNLTFRDVLPPGVSYVNNSGSFGGTTVQPRVIDNAPGPGQTTLIFENVSDISVDSSEALGYRVSHSTGVFGIGSSYVNTATAYADANPRVVPDFEKNGVAKPSATGMVSNTGQASTQISAIQITKSEPSSEGELMRGLHDHQTVYTLRVTNNGIHPTTDISVDDYLPAGLEFLGCGTVDNTTSAPTNPGSAEEYPGSGAIDAPGNAPGQLDAARCLTPTLVETIRTDEGAPQPATLDADAVYTRVRWTGLGQLAPNETIEIQYVAAIPLRENTDAWSGDEPDDDGPQTANLDNNSGPETTDEQPLTNHAFAEGTYRGDDPDPLLHLPVSDATTLTRTAEDLAVAKSVDPAEIAQQGISEWTLRFRTSEYRRVTGGAVTDTLPNGLCPLGSVNYEDPAGGPANAECDPTGSDAPSLDYRSTTENADGSWTIGWALPDLAPNADYELTFPTRTRRFYQQGFTDDPGNPVRAGDSWTNSVLVSGDDQRICIDGDVDCTADPEVRIDGDGLDSRTVTDVSSASQSSGGIEIDKTVLDQTAIGAPIPVDCAAAQTTDPDAYIDAPTVPRYGAGDRVCWRLRVDFSASVDTGTPVIRDFIPEGMAYEAGSAVRTGRDTLGAVTVDDSGAADRVLSWSLSDVDTSDQVFEWTFATIVSADVFDEDEEAEDPDEEPKPTVTGNLMKLSYNNTAGRSFSLRDRVEAEMVKPVVGLVKDVTSVSPAGGSTIADGNATNVPVGSTVTYRVRLGNTGGDAARRTVVWDDLPAGVTCADVPAPAISDGGTCAAPPLLPGRGRIVWDAADAITVPAAGTKDLTYTVIVPQGRPPAASLTNVAGVVQYERDTNRGGAETFVPASNIDPSREPAANAPRADDPASIRLRDVVLAKTRVSTSVDETGNDLPSQATIGETVLYRIQVTVPAGTTLFGTPTVTDDVIPQMELLASPAPTVSQAGGTPVTLTPSVDPATNRLTVAFPGVYANTAATSAVFSVEFVTRVRDVTTPVDANRRGQTLGNAASFRWLPAPGAPTPDEKTANAETVTIVEPNLTVGKLAALTSNLSLQTSTVSAGDAVRYSVFVRNAAGTNVAPSHDTVTVDTVPVGITPRKTDGLPVTATNDQVGIAGFPAGTWNAVARTITWSHGTLLPGADPNLIYEADVDSPAPAGLVLTNSVTVTGSSLTGSDPNERTAGSAFNTGYTTTATRPVTVLGGALTKTGVSPRATVGDVIDYTVEYTLPPNVAFFDLTFVDTLPDGVEYVAGSAQTSCVGTPACTLTGTAASPAFRSETRSLVNGTQRVAWLLDDVADAPDARTIRLTYQGRIVGSYVAPGAGAVDAGDVLTNGVSVFYNATNDGPPPAGFPDTSGYDQTTGPATSDTTVTEPRITLDKHVSGIPVGDDVDRRTTQPGEDYSYTLTVTNTGTSPAYDVDVTDTPGSKLTNVVATAAGVSPAGTATVVDGDGDDGTLAWTIPGPLAPGDTVTLTYTADLADSSLLSADETVVNTATVPSYWNADEVDRTAEPGAYREYTTDPPTDTVTLDVRLPKVSVQKTTGVSDGAGGFLEAADAEVGESFPWRVVITNPSPSSTAHDVEVVDILPAGWSYDAGSAAFAPVPAVPGFDPEPTITTAGGRVNLAWANVGDIAPDGQVVLTFTATPDLDSRPNANPQRNVAAAAGRDSDGQGGSADGPYADDDEADANLRLPTLTVAKTPDGVAPAGVVPAGTTPSYTIVVRNTSTTAPARDVIVTDVLRAHQSYAANAATASPSTGFSEQSRVVDAGDPADPADDTTTIGWRIAQIPANGQVTITVPVTIAAGLASGTTVRNDVSVVSREVTDPVTDEGSFVTTVSSDVGVEKTITAPSGSLVPGQTVTYEIVATNHGPSVATGVVVTDPLPDELTLTASPSGCSLERGTISCAVGTLGVDQSRTFTVTATIDPDATGAVSNTAYVSSTSPDPNDTNDESPVSRSLSPLADLVVTKTTSAASVHQGDEFSYEITVRNDGPSDAVDVTLSDPLPAPGVVLVGATTDTGSCTPNLLTNTVSCTLGTLPPNPGPTPDPAKTATITVTARAVGVGTFDNTATAATPTAQSSTTNDSAEDDVTVLPVANVGIEKTAPATVAANGTLTYALRLFNDGPSAATNVVVEDQLPDGVVFVSASPGCTEDAGTVTCTRATLPVGSGDPADDPVIQITVQVPWALADQTLSNTATIDADELDRTPTDDSSTVPTTVGPAVNLRTTKTAPTLPVPQSVPFEYAVTVTNDGPSTAVGATLSDPMPAGITALQATSDVGTCTVDSAPSRVACQFGDLPKDTTATVTITARGDLPGAPLNTATAASTTPEIDPADNEATDDVEILAAADVGIVKTAPAQTDGDGPLTYRLEITNHGPSDATGVTVTDPLPAGVDLVSADGGCTLTGRTVTCDVGDLAVGDTVVREIVVQVPFALGGETLTNIASVTVDQVDLDPDNDSSQAQTIVGDVADLVVAKTAGGAVAGGQATWTVTVRNDGPTAAQDVVLRDLLPPGTDYRSAQPSAGSCTGSGREVVCALGTMAVGGSVQITVVADVAAHIAGQQLRNVATVSSATPDSDPTNDTAHADVVVSPAPPTSPDLRVTKVASTTTPQLGRPLTYRIEVTNVGGVTADAVRLTDTMNRNARTTRATPAQGTCTIDGTTTTCELGAIAPGQTVPLEVRVTPQTEGALRNTVSVQAAGQAEIRIDNNEAVANVRVSTTRTTVSLRKRASRREIRGGNRVTFTITAKMGRHAGSNVRICDRLPKGLTFVRATGARFSRGQACWTVPYMAAGSTKRFRIVARAERSDQPRSIRNTAVVRARNVARRTASTTIRVTPALAAPAGGVTG